MTYKKLLIGLSAFCLWAGSAWALDINGKVLLNGAPCQKCGPIQNSWSKKAVFTDQKGKFHFHVKAQKSTKLAFYYGEKKTERILCQVKPTRKKDVSVTIYALFADANDKRATGSTFQKVVCDGKASFPMMPPVPAFPPMPGLPPSPGAPPAPPSK